MTQNAAAKPQLASGPLPPTENRLGSPARIGLHHPGDYLPDPGLQAAIKVALTLRKPLLVTGEPGTGKTQLASYISWSLGFRNSRGESRAPLMFEAKSTSIARELFYTYNVLAKFHAAQTGAGTQDANHYITYNALGTAILNANARDAVAPLLPPGFEHDGTSPSVVLIDEIDKAPRDFPNDLLNEIDSMYFRIPELENVAVSAPAEMFPVVVITSNSEKNMPAAFMRRCIYYNIPFPNPNRLEEIIWARIRNLADNHGPFVREAIEFVLRLRDTDSSLQKKPATAELLDWLVYLVLSGADTRAALRDQSQLVASSLSALVKGAMDQESATVTLERWLARK